MPKDLPPPSWPALDKLTEPFLQGAPVPVRMRVSLASYVRGAGRECLKEVELSLPLVRVAPQGDRKTVGVVRVFTNRGRALACEVPRDIWFVAEGGETVQPPAYLAAAPPFATWLDAVSFELPPGTERGELFLGERGPGGDAVAVAQVHLELANNRMTAQRVEDVEVKLVDAVDGAPVAGASVLLTGAPEWRQDRETTQRGRTDPQGRYRFERVEPGTYTVKTAGDRYLNQERDGVYVREVWRHSAAERAGLQADDRILAVEGVRMKSLKDDSRIPGPPGTFVHLEVRRAGQTLELTVQRTPAR